MRPQQCVHVYQDLKNYTLKHATSNKRGKIRVGKSPGGFGLTHDWLRNLHV